MHALGTCLKLALLQTRTHTQTHFPAVLPSVFFLFLFRFISLSMRGHRGHHRGCSAVPLSGVPVASSTIIAVSGLAGAEAHGQHSSSSGVVDSIPPASVAKSFFGMISWYWFGTSLLVLFSLSVGACLCYPYDPGSCSLFTHSSFSSLPCAASLGLVWSRPFQVEREEGSGDTAIPNAFCWNAIISIIRHAHNTCTTQLYHQC